MFAVPLQYLAEFYNVDVRTVQLWAADWKNKYGIEVRNERNSYDFELFVKYRTRDLDDKIAELEKGDATLYAYRKERMQIDTKREVVKFKKMLGELVPYDDVRMAWIGETKLFRKNIFAMVRKVISALKGKLEQKQIMLIEETLTRETKEVLFLISENLKIETEAEEIIEEIPDTNFIPDNEIST